MLVVKEQKKKLQSRMRELQTSREEWRADMEVYSNEPSGMFSTALLCVCLALVAGLHRGFLHGVKESLDGLAHKFNDKVSACNPNSNPSSMTRYLRPVC